MCLVSVCINLDLGVRNGIWDNGERNGGSGGRGVIAGGGRMA